MKHNKLKRVDTFLLQNDALVEQMTELVDLNNQVLALKFPFDPILIIIAKS